MWGGLSGKLKFVNDKGEEIKFNSMVDAANYMVDKGWNFQQAYSSVYGGSLIIHWIFYKDAENMEKAKEGIIIKEDYKKQKKLNMFLIVKGALFFSAFTRKFFRSR